MRNNSCTKRLARMLHKSSDSQRVLITTTQLQRGVLRRPETENRSNGFYAALKTAGAVRRASPHLYTQQKQSINGRSDTPLEGESDL